MSKKREYRKRRSKRRSKRKIYRRKSRRKSRRRSKRKFSAKVDIDIRFVPQLNRRMIRKKIEVFPSSANNTITGYSLESQLRRELQKINLKIPNNNPVLAFAGENQFLKDRIKFDFLFRKYHRIKPLLFNVSYDFISGIGLDSNIKKGA